MQKSEARSVNAANSPQVDFLFFNIYINDLFIIKGDTEVCNYSDDTTYYAHDTSAADVIRKSETAVYSSAIWFDNFIFIFHITLQQN